MPHGRHTVDQTNSVAAALMGGAPTDTAPPAPPVRRKTFFEQLAEHENNPRSQRVHFTMPATARDSVGGLLMHSQEAPQPICLPPPPPTGKPAASEGEQETVGQASEEAGSPVADEQLDAETGEDGAMETDEAATEATADQQTGQSQTCKPPAKEAQSDSMRESLRAPMQDTPAHAVSIRTYPERNDTQELGSLLALENESTQKGKRRVSAVFEPRLQEACEITKKMRSDCMSEYLTAPKPRTPSLKKKASHIKIFREKHQEGKRVAGLLEFHDDTTAAGPQENARAPRGNISANADKENVGVSLTDQQRPHKKVMGNRNDSSQLEGAWLSGKQENDKPRLTRRDPNQSSIVF